MKRVLVVILLVFIFVVFGVQAYAKEYVGSSEDESDIYNYEEYLPDEILQILNENGGQALDKIDINFIFDTVARYIFDAVKKHSSVITEMLALIIFCSIFFKIIDNSSVVLIIRLVFLLLISVNLFDIFSVLCEECKGLLSSVSEMFNLLIPTFASVLLMGGAPTTSAGSVTSVGATVICIETVLSGLGSALAVICFIFIIFEKISPVFSNINASKYIKKYSITLITFICTLLMTVLSFQTVISARADSLSTRSIKFAAANFIPIVGNAVGESLRTVGYGISYLKSSIGTSVSLALFFTVFPILIEIFLIKLITSFLSFTASLCGISQDFNIITPFIEVVDLLLVIIICSFILSLITIFLFTNSVLFN